VRWIKRREEKDAASHNKDIKSKLSSVKKILKSLGPGIITGASDDDPSTIATFSQAGAQFGFGMLWLALFQYPMKAVIQEVCARIGLVTGKGLSSVIKKRYSKKVVLPLASLLLIANTINIGADIAAMGASIKLVFPQLPVIVAALFLLHLLFSQKFL
jgi:NRAMP (natural resistance-associated macrophage protein)-like metal ion transporter